ncbi:MAG: HAD-IIB family hydrolase [Bacillota bacterium]
MLGFPSGCRKDFQESLYITKSQYNYLEFLHPEATKGRGLSAVAEALGILPGEIMAIGDSYNDVEMFKFAGSAVAMGNARQEVRAAADYVTAANVDDGVAEILERLVIA